MDEDQSLLSNSGVVRHDVIQVRSLMLLDAQETIYAMGSVLHRQFITTMDPTSALKRANAQTVAPLR